MADEILPEVMATGCLPQPISTRTGIDLYTGVLIPSSQYRSTRVLAKYVPRGKCQSSVPACFPPGTLVRMADGSQMPIESVKNTDRVLTAEGNISTVVKTMAKQETEKVYRLNLWGHRHLRATGEHPILTKRGYVKIKNLKLDDYVAIPRYIAGSVKVLMTRDYIDDKRFTVGRGATSRSVAGRKVSVITTTKPPEVIELTESFGRIVGLFLAEGWTHKGSTLWCFGKHEEHTLAAELVGLIQKEFGVTARIQHREKSINVVLSGVLWARLFENLCSTGAGNKSIHPDLTSGPKEFLEAVLGGWQSGDGLGPNQNGGVTISHKLAMSMFDIANYLGNRPTIESLDVKTYGQVATRRKRYQVKWYGNEGREDDWRSELQEKTLYRKVSGVTEEAYSGWVYNLEVEGDHSYVAEGVGVHNCNWYSTIKAYQTVFAMRTGKPYPELSYCANYQIATNGDFDAGTLPLDAIKQISQQGIVPVGPGMPEWFNRPTQIPAALMQRRSVFRGLGWEECRTGGQVISAVLNTDPVNIGIDWMSEDVNPGPTGFLGVGGHVIGGHSVLAIGIEMGYKLSPSGIGVVFSNHHGDKLTPAFRDERGNTLRFPVWGDDGIGIVPIERVADGIVKYGSFALRSIMLTSEMIGDLPEPVFTAAA